MADKHMLELELRSDEARELSSDSAERFFDSSVPDQPGRAVRGHWFEYNEPAANDTRGRVRGFLATNRSGSTTEKPASR